MFGVSTASVEVEKWLITGPDESDSLETTNVAQNSDSDIDQKENPLKRRRTVINSTVSGEVSSDGEDSKIN